MSTPKGEEKNSAAARAALPRGVGYDIIYADPPWRYDNSQTPYPTMDMEELKTLPVPAAANSLLFMWATSPMLPPALELMAAWGFEFKTVAWVWHKTNPKNGQGVMGTGFYTRQSCEVLLLGTRGSGHSKRRKRRNCDQYQALPRSAHSRKPPEFRRMIEDVFEGERRIELFARETHEGWDAWGFDVDGYFYQCPNKRKRGDEPHAPPV